MRADVEEVGLLIGIEIVIVIVIMRGSETVTGMVTVIDLERGIAEEAEDRIGSTVVPGMEEREARKDTTNVTEAGHVLLLGMVTGGPPGVQFANIEDSVGGVWIINEMR